MKILITGGAGYIGTELVYELNKNPEVKEIVVYDNLSRGNINLFIGSNKLSNKIKFIQGDILDTRLLRESLKGVDVVYHLAAKVTTPFADQNAHFFEQVNHWGTAELTYAIEESEVKKFIYTSSASVYGASSQEADEQTFPNPKTFYGISKLRGEEQVNRLFDKDMEVFIIRCGNIYGYSKSMRFDSVINKFMFEANFKNRIAIKGSGDQHRSFIHVDKTANILSNLIFSKLPKGTYDLVEDNLSINEIAETFKDIFPKLENIFISQQLKMRELKVKPNPKINALTNIPTRTLLEVLSAFKKEFTF
ncbi:MAG: SDR family oxidoreductase [Flavobacteriaceae bacterium]|nr:SDR family oxidoreductase [Flavobacteriaceae bacterium]